MRAAGKRKNSEVYLDPVFNTTHTVLNPTVLMFQKKHWPPRRGVDSNPDPGRSGRVWSSHPAVPMLPFLSRHRQKPPRDGRARVTQGAVYRPPRPPAPLRPGSRSRNSTSLGAWQDRSCLWTEARDTHSQASSNSRKMKLIQVPRPRAAQPWRPEYFRSNASELRALYL